MASRICGGKRSWPELVGEKGEFAVATIARENPHVQPVIVPEGTGVTQQLRCYRVVVLVNKHGIVYETGKESWPELVGVEGEIAAATIAKENPRVNPIIVNPELVGVEGEIAAATIAKENPRVNPIIVQEGWIVQQDLRYDRVHVLVNKHGIVVEVPVVG